MLSEREIMEYVTGTRTVDEKKQFSITEAKNTGDAMGIRWDKFDVDQFAMGMNIELEHGRRDPATDVTHDEPMVTGKIALAHLNEIPDYYTRLVAREQDAEQPKDKRH